ncbi:MAG: hypothetical protein SGI84_03405 [Gemmatimonadota bacterium]|nr:hypothetical protein [Gemmatimonadota bacterium]
MSQVATFIRANPAVGVILAALGIVAVVFTILTILMTRAGTSLRPLVFMGVFLAIVGAPQVAFHLAQALEWIPKRDLTWVAAREFWFYRPVVLVPVLLVLVALATLWFFKGSSWASTVPAVAGVAPLRQDALRQRLLAANQVDAPYTVAEEHPGGRIVVTWRFADAKWVDMARAHGLRRSHRLLLELDEARQVVRPTEQFSALDWSAGPRGGGVHWRTGIGITFFQVEHQRGFGLQLDDRGRFLPQPSYAYSFNLQEMKAPFIAATTQAGWDWRPTAWHGPSWLHWLTR